MKFPKTAEDVVSEIYISSDKYKQYGDLRSRQLIRMLGGVADDILVEAVIQVFEGTNRVESHFLDQEIVGRILEERKPFTTISPEKLLERCLTGWNKSVEQFPFWLVEVYGIEKTQAALAIIENKELLKIEREKLATIRWWIHKIK
ncbi:hypothetical protein [Hymenobacter volaticus]|uniref:Uncharacterized protein n=1 Tax=Hymenobacter volaticus TaxID=2932254 RepID=A0ABY4G121_9BACT|nr:hypothetical protein [Hymenobacter volaticus]UOQ64503.1 hypothetical protein MUN86_12980 [Hymenobacter volaticus]